METTNFQENDIRSWLKVALVKENLLNFSVKIAGTAEKCDGYVGDIVFVSVTGINKQCLKKKYNLALKCSKINEVLLEKVPYFKQAFIREIYMYEHVLPSFRQFQLDRGIRNSFEIIPRCYGVFSDETRKVIAFENLKKIGYDLWDGKKPLTRSHVDLVVKEYGKFHAISVAMKEHEPEKFEKLTKGLASDLHRELLRGTNLTSIFENVVEELYHLLEHDLEETVLHTWLSLKEKIRFICLEMSVAPDDLQVIVHGDCWNNNFMYRYEDETKSVVSNVAFLDWQISKLYSPILDLSYFIFCCISQQDILNLDTILKNYHDSFCNHLARCGINAMNKYPFEKFLQEWKKYSGFGVIMCLLAIKVSYASDNKPDMATSAEKEEDIFRFLYFDLRENTDYKNRMMSIVKYAVEHGLI